MSSEPRAQEDVARWMAARDSANRTNLVASVVGGLIAVVLIVPSFLLASTMAGGAARYAFAVLWMALFLAPAITFAFRASRREHLKSDRFIEHLAGSLQAALRDATQETARREAQARQQRFERRVANALEMAENEADVVDVVQRALAAAAADCPAELLLADNSHAHLVRMAISSPTGEPPGCSVDSPDHCPAARRAQTQRFPESEQLDACPRLRGRPSGPSAAVCVPVSVMGRTVGVIHATADPGAAFADPQVDNLETLANLTGARVGLLRVMAETQLQAVTDNLTGLLNRRSFEQQFAARRRNAAAMCVVMADLDRFKELNDTYGHDTGDRALRLFAQTARGALRAGDLVGRHGGEEFVLAMSDCDAQQTAKALDALRARLDAAITVAGLPKFTASFGVIQAQPDEDLPSLIGRADAALFEAKRTGRDRVVIHDRHRAEAPLLERN